MIGGGGILAGIAINTSWAFMASFGLVGLGFSTIIPIVYRAAGSMPGLDRSTGVAAVATACYSAFLIGPPVMGFVADQLSLRASFAMVGLATAIVVVLAPATQRHSAQGASQARTDDSLETATAVVQ
jgi:fucose permease